MGMYGDFVTRRVPAFGWLPRYDGSWLRSDVIAGITTASVILPKAMAYATLAGLPVQVGLYTVLLPTVVYALLGTSRRLSVSTTTTLGILTAAEIADVAPRADAAQALAVATTLALAVGVVLVLAALLRLGFVAQFISEPVLSGFKAGIGIVIVVDQVPKLLGIHFEKGSVFHNAGRILAHLAEAHPGTLLVAAATILLMVAAARVVPKLPGPLFAVAAGIAASGLFGLAAMGVETVGAIPSGLPRFTAPQPTLLPQLWAGAVGIALMSFTESIAVARAFGGRGEPRPDANQELLALGAANAVGGLFGAMPAGGGTSQTSVNVRAGAKSQVAALVSAAATIAVLGFLAPLIELMPQATLAAVVVVTSMGLIDVSELAAIRRVRTVEFRWAVAAMAGVVILGTLPGILVAIVLSMLSLLRQANDPPLYVLGRKPGTDVFRRRDSAHPEDEAFEGLLVLRTEGRIYFANAQRLVDKIVAIVDATRPRVLLLDCSAVPDIEFTALKGLIDLEASLWESGTSLWLAALNPAALAVVNRVPLGARLGRERMHFTVPLAVAAYVAGGSGEHPELDPPAAVGMTG
jgi:high affinity sulfate transporter 1